MWALRIRQTNWAADPTFPAIQRGKADRCGPGAAYSALSWALAASRALIRVACGSGACLLLRLERMKAARLCGWAAGSDKSRIIGTATTKSGYRARRTCLSGMVAFVSQRRHLTSSQSRPPMRRRAIVDDGCAGPPYSSIGPDQDYASARSLAASVALARDFVLIGLPGMNSPVFGKSFPSRTHYERAAMPLGLASARPRSTTASGKKQSGTAGTVVARLD
jgi:hypothetical protein